MDRRAFLKNSAATATALAAVPGAAAFRPALAQSGPIKIGFLAPLTGVVAAGGKDMVDAFNLFWKQNGTTVAGRPVEVTVEDDASNPDTALQKARRLVQQREVHMLVGDILANTGLAVAEFVRGTGTPYLIPIVAADNLTQRDRIPNVVRVAGFAASQITRPLADWALKQGYKTVATIAQDYAFGHEQTGGFVQTFTEGGGKVVGQLWNPLNTSDLSPYIGQLQQMKPDVVFAMETGADAGRLLQQWVDYGLKGQLPLIATGNSTDQSVIRTLGNIPEGIVTVAHFAEGREAPGTAKFVKDYEKEFGKLPAFYAASCYAAGQCIVEALKAIGGKVEDREAFLAAIKKVSLPDSPLGPITMDDYGNPVYDLFIRKVVKRADGKYWNVVIETYPKVSQFWKYNPEQYMKQPPYSRDFQGIKS